MSCTFTPDLQLAVGHDNAGGLIPITSVTDGTYSLDIPFDFPFANEGVLRFTIASPVYSGTFSGGMLFTRIAVDLLDYLRTDYRGFVTVKYPFNGLTYANFNASLIIPNNSELGTYVEDSELDTWTFQQVFLPLDNMVAL